MILSMCEAPSFYLKRQGLVEALQLLCNHECSIREVYNSFVFVELIDGQYHKKFDLMEATARALGALDEELETIDAYRHRALLDWPVAKSSHAEVTEMH
jgi:hypothetical protein